jgi:hypothetical protein
MIASALSSILPSTASNHSCECGQVTLKISNLTPSLSDQQPTQLAATTGFGPAFCQNRHGGVLQLERACQPLLGDSALTTYEVHA